MKIYQTENQRRPDNIFWQPLGTVRDLGTVRQWTGDVIAVLAVLAGLIVLGLLILL